MSPVGSVVTITYDAEDGGTPKVDDYLRTPSNRLYCVLVARKMASKYPNRFRLTLLVIDEIPADADPRATLWPLKFYAR